MTKPELNFKVSYGLIAVTPDSPVGGPYNILHFVGFEKKPSEEDYEHIYEELQTDEELGMVGVDYDLIDATPEIIKAILEANGYHSQGT